MGLRARHSDENLESSPLILQIRNMKFRKGDHFLKIKGLIHQDQAKNRIGGELKEGGKHSTEGRQATSFSEPHVHQQVVRSSSK